MIEERLCRGVLSKKQGLEGWEGYKNYKGDTASGSISPYLAVDG
jgi:hypothetical protein